MYMFPYGIAVSTLLNQVGSIPYGEVFGERFGYASIQEFLSYMDHYAQDPAPEVGGRGRTGNSREGEEGEGVFSPPLYVFDSHVLEQNFSRFYSMPGEYVIVRDYSAAVR